MSTKTERTIMSTVVGWISAAWAAVVSFTGMLWEKAATAVFKTITNPQAQQVSFGLAFIYGCYDAFTIFMIEMGTISLMAMPFAVLLDTLAFGAAGLGLAFLAVLAGDLFGSTAVSVWNWISYPFRTKSGDDVVDHKAKAARKNTRVVPPSGAAAGAI